MGVLTEAFMVSIRPRTTEVIMLIQLILVTALTMAIDVAAHMTETTIGIGIGTGAGMRTISVITIEAQL